MRYSKLILQKREVSYIFMKKLKRLTLKVDPVFCVSILYC